ncbi:MAG: Fe-S-cluster containining protein [Pseudoalteromonas tetraodonis]|jgi:Fe-S-cluster containining protein
MTEFQLGSTVPEEAKIHYQCQRCGNCCKWPGDVVITEDETEKIAAFLKMPVAEFVENHTRLRANRQGLSIDDKPNGECLFLNGIDCRINPVKPAQCAGFPNSWNFPGWRKVCEAIPVQLPENPKESTCEPPPSE